MVHFNFRDLNIKAVYFFYIDDNLVYVGRSCNLKNRLLNHFYYNQIDECSWKSKVTRIQYIKCESITDTDILETYYINKYNPIYNKDKVYLDKSLLNIDESGFIFSEVLIINNTSVLNNQLLVDIKVGRKISFMTLCLEYLKAIDINDDLLLQEIEVYYPLVKQAYEELGAEKMKALKYRKAYIEKELLLVEYLNTDKDIIKYLNIKIGDVINKSEIKLKLQVIYNTLGIKKTAKATDLSQWYFIKDCERTIEGKRIKLLKILDLKKA